MPRQIWRVLACSIAATVLAAVCSGQTALTWNQVRERFRANNPSVIAAGTGIQELRANEVTAGLRPNPSLSFIADEFRILHPNPLQPFQNSQITPVVSQLFERANKRRLRVDSARLSTRIAGSDQADLERTLTFSLRDGFNHILQAKALLALASDNHGDRQGPRRQQARLGQRIHGSDRRSGIPAHASRQHSRLERRYPDPYLRPESGRKGAHVARNQADRAASRRPYARHPARR